MIISDISHKPYFKNIQKAVKDSAVTQEVNQKCSYIVSYPCLMEMMNDSLSKYKVDKLREITCLKLVDNIDPHYDDSFIRAEGLSRKVLAIITESKPINAKYPDSPSSNYFYTNKKWITLNTGDMFWFDASKEHAVMLSSTIHMMTLWFNK